MTQASDHREFLLGIADDKHFIGQQHAEWIGVTPFLEEDLAFCSIGQDELGHAAAIYALLTEDTDVAIDDIAFGRDASEFRCSWFTEHVTTSWPEALVRHWLFDTADALRWELLATSSVPELAELAVRVESEERYHRLHANSLLDALMTDQVARQKIAEAVKVMAPMSLGLFDPTPSEPEAIAAGVATGEFDGQMAAFKKHAQERFGDIDWDGAPAQANRTVRSTGFEALLSRMREVLDFDPQATW